MILLSVLPCGCVVDLETVRIWDGVLECMWCGMTINLEDMRGWQNYRPAFVQRRAPILVRVGDQALPVIGQCRHGCPVVKINDEEVHLDGNVEVLPD